MRPIYPSIHLSIHPSIRPSYSIRLSKPIICYIFELFMTFMNCCQSRSDGWDGTGGWVIHCYNFKILITPLTQPVSPDVLGFAIIFYKCLLEKSILFCGLDARRLLLYPFCVERTAESLLILLVCIQSQHTAARGPGWTFPNLTEHAFNLDN